MMFVRTLALCSLLVACKGKTEGGATGGADEKFASCHSASLGSCREYNAGNLAMGSSSLAELCTSLDKSAVFAGTRCPTAGVVSSCAKKEGKDYYYAAWSIADDKNEKYCTDGGGTYVRGK